MMDLKYDTHLTPKIAKLYAMLSETRERLLEQIKDISQEQLDFSPSITKIETIGTLLFHIAAIEFSYIFEDIYEEQWDQEEWKYSLALREQLDPPQMTGKPISFYLDKLSEIRERVYSKVLEWTDKDLDRVVKSGKREVTINWILYHINYHESVHIGQINFLKRLFKLEK